MPDISLHCEADGLLACFNIAEGTDRKFALQEILDLLKQRNVVFGIDQDALQQIASGALKGRIPVASGKPMVPSTPGRLEWFIDLSKVGKPRQLEDGRVNLRDLQIDLNVRKGDRLVRRIAPVAGQPGTTVYGTPLYPLPPEDAVITLGKGTDRESNDPDCIVASIDGAVTFDGRAIEVHNRKVINGDVDYATGNVFFNGDLKITGSVRAGFNVSARGDIYINGNVEDTEIKSGGSVIVNGGAIGSGNGTITSNVSIKVRHSAQFTLSAEKGVIIQEDALHSKILSEGNVTARAIIGGSVSAFSIAVEIAGSSAEARTVLDATLTAQLSRERYNLLKEFGALTAQRAVHYENMYALVRNGMDAKGHLPYNNLQTLELLKDNTLESMKAAERIQTRLEKIDELEKERQGDSTIAVGIAYPNTIIKIGNEERLIKEEERNIFLTASRSR